MAYNPDYSANNEKRRREKYKRVGIDFEKNYYSETLKPAADQCSMTVNGFIKQAVDEKIDRMKENVL